MCDRSGSPWLLWVSSGARRALSSRPLPVKPGPGQPTTRSPLPTSIPLPPLSRIWRFPRREPEISAVPAAPPHPLLPAQPPAPPAPHQAPSKTRLRLGSRDHGGQCVAWCGPGRLSLRGGLGPHSSHPASPVPECEHGACVQTRVVGPRSAWCPRAPSQGSPGPPTAHHRGAAATGNLRRDESEGIEQRGVLSSRCRRPKLWWRVRVKEGGSSPTRRAEGVCGKSTGPWVAHGGAGLCSPAAWAPQSARATRKMPSASVYRGT